MSGDAQGQAVRRRYNSRMDPLRIYEYLTLSRQRVLSAVRALSANEYRREFPFGLRTIGRALAHIMISEWYYVERLEGSLVPPYREWPIQDESPPAFEVIESVWREQSERIRAIVARERDWNRKITWLSFPDVSRGGKRFHIVCSAGDLFTQLALHEAHHRSQVMAMLRELGRPVQDIDFNDLMFERNLAEEPGA